MQHGLGHHQYQDTKLRFSHPLQCDRAQFDQLLDCYSGMPQGHWPIRPKLVAPLEHYEACHKVLEAHPEYETVGEYLLAALRAVDPTVSSLLEEMLVQDE